MNPTRTSVANCDHRIEPKLPLDVQVIGVQVRVFQVPLNGSHSRNYGRGKGGIWKRRIRQHRARSCRRIRHSHNQVLLIVRVEVNPVAATQGRFAIAENVPGETDARRNVLRRRVLVPASMSHH